MSPIFGVWYKTEEIAPPAMPHRLQNQKWAYAIVEQF